MFDRNLNSLIVFAFVMLGAPSCAQHVSNASDLSYPEAVAGIVARAGTFVNFDLIDDPQLRVIYEHPERYEADARRLIADTNAPFHERRIALITMQCLSLSEYLSVIRLVSELDPSEENRLLTHHAILPGFQWSTRIARLFENRSVRDVLGDVMESRMLDENLKAAINKVLSGAIATYITEQAEEPRWKCRSASDAIPGGT
jgi:hypothetical protein